MYLDYTPEQKQLRDHLRTYFADMMTPALRAELTGSEGGGPLYQHPWWPPTAPVGAAGAVCDTGKGTAPIFPRKTLLATKNGLDKGRGVVSLAPLVVNHPGAAAPTD